MSFHLNYSFADGRKDLLAGLTVAAISLPQGMAYALIAGVDPRYGLYSAVFITAIASVFGSSSHLINGPTSAISLVVFSVLAGFDPEARVEAAQAMLLVGIMAGTIQILIAVFKLGDLTRYISESVILGFMAGAAVLLAIGQVGNALGVREQGTGDQQVLYRLWLTLTQGDPVNVRALSLTAATIVLALLLRKAVRRYRLPQMDMLLALLAVALFAYFATWTQPGAAGKTAVAVAGTIPSSLPTPHIPQIKFVWVRDLASGALAVAFLGLVEALAIAKSIASQSRQKFDYNRQCLAEGIANLAGGFFQCLPGSGSLSRSAVNFQAGAVSRFSGLVASATVAIAVLMLAPLTQYLPKAALAGLLLVIAARLIDTGRIRYTLRASGYDAGLVIITALSGVLIGVDSSVLIGFGLSVLLFVPRAAKLKASELVVSPERVVRERLSDDPPCTAMVLYDLEGELFFGAAPELERYFAEIERRVQSQGVRYVVLRLKRVRNPDVVCIERFEHFLRNAAKIGVTVLLAGVRSDFLLAIKRLHFAQWYPSDRVFPQQDEEDSATLAAVRAVYRALGDANPCPHCTLVKAKHKLYYLV